MKYFAFLTFLIFAGYLLGFIKKTEKYQWMDRNYTTAIKGFSILTVVWAHSGARLSIGGIQFIAGIGVALFLMCSGYGLEISYEKNGLEGFWKKRLLGVCLPFWTVELVGALATGTFSIKTYLLDSCFLKPATSYGWFMGYIVICYLIFYVVKMAERRHWFCSERSPSGLCWIRYSLQIPICRSFVQDRCCLSRWVYCWQ